MIVGVTGLAQHGKDTVGRRLADRWGFERFAFADPLKSMALVLDPLIRIDHAAEKVIKWRSPYARLAPLVEYVGWEKAKEAKEVRRFLQVLGTEGVRNHLGDNAWIDAAEQALVDAGILYIYDDPMMTSGAFDIRGSAVFTDVRFPNEAAYIHRRAGKVIRVTRFERVEVARFGDPEPEYVRGAPFDNGLGADHPSERLVPTLDVDYDIANDGTLAVLDLKVDALVRELRGVCRCGSFDRPTHDCD